MFWRLSGIAILGRFPEHISDFGRACINVLNAVMMLDSQNRILEQNLSIMFRY